MFNSVPKILVAKKQLLKYGVTGGSALLADYSGFVFLYSFLRTPLWVASTLSLVIGFLVSFLLNRMWVFQAHTKTANKATHVQVILYSLLFIFNNIFTYYFIVFLKNAGLSPYIGKLGAVSLIMVWNFIAYKTVIFKADALGA